VEITKLKSNRNPIWPEIHTKEISGYFLVTHIEDVRVSGIEAILKE
jgi:hypothetical protein